MNVIREDRIYKRGRGLGRSRGREGARFQISSTRIQGRVPFVTPFHLQPGPSNRSTTATSSRARGKRNSTNPSTSGSGSRPRTTSSEFRTPRSNITSTTDENYLCVVAVTEGRGLARGEVGLAAMNLNHPHLILCQLSDSQTYVNTITKINVLNPIEILVPNTFCDVQTNSKLYTLLQESFPTVTITSVLRRHFKDTVGMEQIRRLCALEYSSLVIVVAEKFYALASAAALLKYVEFVRNVLFQPRSLKIEYQGSQNTMVIDMKTAHLLELVRSLRGSDPQYSLMGILNHCQTHGGTRLLRSSILEPPYHLETTENRLESVQEILETPELLHALNTILKKFCDADQLLKLSMHMPRQDQQDVAELQLKHTLLLKTILESVPALKLALENSNTKIMSAAKETLSDERYKRMEDKILAVIHNDARTERGVEASQTQCNFAVRPGISHVLDIARHTYCEIIDDIRNVVTRLSEEHGLPLKVKYNLSWGYHIQLSDTKRRIDELHLPPVFVQVHKSRGTLSFTTEELIQLDRRSKESVKEIIEQSGVVICTLLADIREDIGCLFKLCEVVAELDMLTSFAISSSTHSYVRPKFDDILDVKQSRHPILDYTLQREPTPNDVYSSSDYNCHIITGPNMGGKSIYIRQIALLQIMAQIGCYVPAQKATFRISDHIFSRLHFDDSIEMNASTFVLELKEFQYIKQMLTPHSLVIVDELCRGTSCEEGTAVAWVILENLMEEDAFIFVTTHFLFLTKLQEMYCNVTNHYFEALEQQGKSGRELLFYTHKLLPGVTQLENYGLRLAEASACPESVLEEAKKLAKELSSQRKAFHSPRVENKETHNYYKLASTVIEYQRKGILTSEKLEELKQKFSNLNVSEKDTSEQTERGTQPENEKEAPSITELPTSYISQQEETETRERYVEGAGSHLEEPSDVQLHCSSNFAAVSNSATVLQQESSDSFLISPTSKRVKANTYSSTVMSDVFNSARAEEPMEIEYTDYCTGMESVRRTPIISLPAEIPEEGSFRTILDLTNETDGH